MSDLERWRAERRLWRWVLGLALVGIVLLTWACVGWTLTGW